jgi:hypothetical protein
MELQTIKKEVFNYYDIDISDNIFTYRTQIVKFNKKVNVTHVKMVLCYLCLTKTIQSQVEVGRFLGIDRTTALYHRDNMQQLIDNNGQFIDLDEKSVIHDLSVIEHNLTPKHIMQQSFENIKECLSFDITVEQIEEINNHLKTLICR